jgi:hypothetical protein
MKVGPRWETSRESEAFLVLQSWFDYGRGRGSTCHTTHERATTEHRRHANHGDTCTCSEWYDYERCRCEAGP